MYLPLFVGDCKQIPTSTSSPGIATTFTGAASGLPIRSLRFPTKTSSLPAGHGMLLSFLNFHILVKRVFGTNSLPSSTVTSFTNRAMCLTPTFREGSGSAGVGVVTAAAAAAAFDCSCLHLLRCSACCWCCFRPAFIWSICCRWRFSERIGMLKAG